MSPPRSGAIEVKVGWAVQPLLLEGRADRVAPMRIDEALIIKGSATAALS
jgi:hypothetical protein